MIKSRRCFNLDYSSGAYGIAEKLSAKTDIRELTRIRKECIPDALPILIIHEI